MEFLSILFRVNVSLLIFFVVYRVALRRLTFYNFNRIYLLASVLLSMLIPLLQYSDMINSRINTLQIAVGIPSGDFRQLIQRGFHWDLVSIATTIYWSGVMVFAAIFLLQLLSLLALYIRSNSATILGYKIRTVQEKLQPFSFFKSIFINPESHAIPEQVFILEHEAVHIRQWHSLDIIIGELKRIFCWFNPASWLILGAIRENLEYIADRKVLQSGVDAKEYQYALLAVKQQQQRNTLTNSFNFSHLKLRITMMNKSKSSDLHLVKYLAIVPIVAIASIVTNYAHAQKIELKPVEKVASVAVPSIDISVAPLEVKEARSMQEKALELIHGDDTVFDASKVSLKIVTIGDNGELILTKSKHDNLDAAAAALENKLAEKDVAHMQISSNDKAAIISSDKISFIKPMQLLMRNLEDATSEQNGQNSVPHLKVKPIDENVIFLIDGKPESRIFKVELDNIESMAILKGANAKAVRPDIDDNTSIIQIVTKGKGQSAKPGATHAFDVTIYPNPATSSVQIKVNSSDVSNSYQMYDRHGKMVAEGKLNPNTKISTEGMDTGTYFIKMKIEGTSKEGKVELIK